MTAPATESCTIGVDVGATTIKSAIVDHGMIVGSTTCRTPNGSAKAVEDAIVASIETLQAQGLTTGGVGIGTPGWTSADRRTVIYSPNLPWRDEPVAEQVEERVQSPVVLENDANAAAWGEYRFGVARGASSMIAITLGSGVGGAIVLGGQLVRGRDGCAGEIGHTRRESGGRPCACGRSGCMENYVSGRALLRDGGFGPDYDCFAAGAAGETAALAVIAAFGRHLGIGLADSVLLLNPDVVVIGGGVAESFALFGKSAADALAGELGPNWAGAAPPIVAATLGSDAGRIGAADLARAT